MPFTTLAGFASLTLAAYDSPAREKKSIVASTVEKDFPRRIWPIGTSFRRHNLRADLISGWTRSTM